MAWALARACGQTPTEVPAAATEMVPEARDQKEAEKLHQSGAGVRPQVASEDEKQCRRQRLKRRR